MIRTDAGLIVPDSVVDRTRTSFRTAAEWTAHHEALDRLGARWPRRISIAGIWYWTQQPRERRRAQTDAARARIVAAAAKRRRKAARRCETLVLPTPTAPEARA